MQVYLDDQPLEVASSTLEAAIDAAIRAASSQGRIVVDGHADGRRLDEAEYETPSTKPDLYAEVKFLSAEPVALVRAILLDASQAMDGLAEDQSEAASHVQAGDLSAARPIIEQAIRTWQAAMTAVDRGGQLLGIDFSSRSFGEPPIPLGQKVEQLASRLRSITEAMRRHDWSDVADGLELDLGDQARQWKTLLRQLAQSLPSSESA